MKAKQADPPGALRPASKLKISSSQANLKVVSTYVLNKIASIVAMFLDHRFFVIIVSKILPAKHSKLEFDGILSPAVETDSVLLED